MFAVIDKDNKFTGVTYDLLNDNIKAHHEKYNHSFVVVESRPVDSNPVDVDDFTLPDYGSPTQDQLNNTIQYAALEEIKSTDTLMTVDMIQILDPGQQAALTEYRAQLLTTIKATNPVKPQISREVKMIINKIGL